MPSALGTRPWCNSTTRAARWTWCWAAIHRTTTEPNAGVSLLAIAVGQSPLRLSDPPLSRAGSLLQGFQGNSTMCGIYIPHA
ncbi:hypothetical protein C9I49_19780 [Pseudomonas prosekii]|uniref:Uncharacterized protein n=1 Tax=Pseudomonas prosekii TaxID=1148509 RepID=A0A2U2D4H6_9PSED|nr:hypothetical protein C9I49_19780 [Pseudomonas prosekii]